MLFGASRSALLFVPLALFVSLSIFLLPSHFSSYTIRHVYQRQLSVTTQLTFTTATLTNTVVISTVSLDQPELLSQSSSTSSLSTSFQPTLPSSFALSTSSSSSLLSVGFLSSTSRHREATSLTSRASSAISKTTISFLRPSTPLSTPPTPVPLSASVSTVTSILPVITSPASSNQDVPPPPFTAASPGVINSGFWGNKGAVGGTFAAVGLVALGIGAILLVVCIRKKRNKKPDREFYSDVFHKGSSYDWPLRVSLSGQSRQPVDPFAAGDITPIRMPLITASISSKHGRVNLEDNQTSSDDHTSSNHASYSVTHSDSCANLSRPAPAPFHRQLGSPASASSLRTGLDLPPAHKPAVPVSPMSMASLSPVPSPFDAGRVDRRGRYQDSGASFYAGQLHSYYYGENDESPSSARSFWKAF